MIVLSKDPEKDLKILNISDPQLRDKDWVRRNRAYSIMTNTVTELISRVKPSLITVSGDISWSDDHPAYEKFADFINSFNIPWAVIWGNNDNHGGDENTKRLAGCVTAKSNCIYESGEPCLGNGNYVIAISENGRIAEALIMMDTHDRVQYTDTNGQARQVWASLTLKQAEWYAKQVEELKELGCSNTTLITHIPIHAYKDAINAAHDDKLKYEDITVEDSYNGIGWKDGYKDSVGVMWDGEGVSCYPEDDGMFNIIKRLGSTKQIIAGHNHMNNFIINYEGIKLVYSLKLGEGSYWDPHLNGGTVINVTSNGVDDIHHEYVDPKEQDIWS